MDNTLQMLKDLPEIVKTVRGMVDDPYGFSVLVILFLIGLYRISESIYDFVKLYKDNQNKDFELLSSYENGKEIDELLLSVIRQNRNRYYFNKISRIDIKDDYRDALIWLHRNTSMAIEWRQIKMTLSYMVFNDDSTVSIREFSRKETNSYYFNVVVAAIYLLIGGLFPLLFFIVVCLYDIHMDVFYDLLPLISLVAMGLYLFYMNLPYLIAGRIRNELVAKNYEIEIDKNN